MILFTGGVRASKQEQVGGAGVSRVTAAFEMMVWGTVENQRHDLGTDLFVMARDERRYDLGLVVGAQVKTGLPGWLTLHRWAGSARTSRGQIFPIAA